MKKSSSDESSLRSSQRRLQDRSTPPRRVTSLASPPLSAPASQIRDTAASRFRLGASPSFQMVEDEPLRKLGKSFRAIISKNDDKWGTSSKRMEIPPEHKASWEFTKQRVIQAATSVLDTTLDVAYEVIVISAELLELAPIPGMQNIAKTMIYIWNSLQAVDSNRLQFLRLTGRCADILMCVHLDIQNAGDSVVEELKLPIQTLSRSFMDIHEFLQDQIRRPFIQRYLKRDDIQTEIAESHQRLNDALGMFSFSIQIKILKISQEANCQGTETKTSIVALGRPGSPPLSDSSSLSSSSDEEVLSSIDKLVARQNSSDAAADAETLRRVLQSAIAARSDLAMVETLGVEQNEMADAIETLQHALQRLVDKNDVGIPKQGRDVDDEVDVRQDVPSPERDNIEREFLESGIGALRRLSGLALESPSWTITKFEVEFTCKIGIGFFSSVYRGTWRNQTVAIKLLAQTTPRNIFVKEVDIWRKLHHPNILELYGASSTSGDPPWFLVSPYLKEGSLVEFLRKAEDELDADHGTSDECHNGYDAGLGFGRSKRPTIALQRHQLLNFILGIAKGMAYLHDQNVLHGDMKAANVLVTDERHCVITDFGQSDMKSEAYRISGTPRPGGTLRWQAPELMSGASRLTTKTDIYAFAVVCFEIISLGKMPWPLEDDITVRHYILSKNARPALPYTPFFFQGLEELLRLYWHQNPSRRPEFSRIVEDIDILQSRVDEPGNSTPAQHGGNNPLPMDSSHALAATLLCTAPSMQARAPICIASRSLDEYDITAASPVEVKSTAGVNQNATDPDRLSFIARIKKREGTMYSKFVVEGVNKDADDEGIPFSFTCNSDVSIPVFWSDGWNLIGKYESSKCIAYGWDEFEGSVGNGDIKVVVFSATGRIDILGKIHGGPTNGKQTFCGKGTWLRA